MTPAGDVYGGGSPTGNVFYENGALGPSWEGTFFAADAGRNEVFSYQPARAGRGLRARPQDLPDLERQAAVRRLGLHRRQRRRPRARSRRCSGRRTSPSVPTARCTSATGSTRASAATRIWTRRCPARSTGSPRRASCSKVPAFDAVDDRRPDHRAAIAGGQRPRDRLRRAEGARRGRGRRRSRRCSTIRARTCAAARSTCSISSGPRAGSARARRSRTPIRRCASPPTARCGAPASTSCRWRRVSPATPMPASAARSRCRCAISRRTRRWTSSSTSRAASTGRIAATSKRSGTGATGKEPALYDRLQARPRRQGRSAGVVAGIRADRVAAARAGGGGRRHGARAVGEAVARRPPASRSTRWPSSTIPPRRRRCSASRSRTAPLREPATLWLLNRMSERLGGLRPAAGAQGGRHLRSRDDHAARKSVVPRPAADLPELSVDEIVELTGDAARGKDTSDALPDVPLDRRHRRRARAGARRLGPRQVGRRHRHRASSGRAPRSRTATTGTEIKTKDGLTIQGVLIKEGDPLMMRSMGGVTQIIPADRVGVAPPDAGVADDERRAARPHRAGRRRPRRVPAHQLKGARVPGCQGARVGAKVPRR